MHPVFGEVSEHLPAFDNITCLPFATQVENIQPFLSGTFARQLSEFKVISLGKITHPTVVKYAYDEKNREAVSLVYHFTQGKKDNFFLEKELLYMGLKHKNIVELYGIVFNKFEKNYYIAFEPHECYLSQLIDEHKDLLVTPVIKSVIHQILSGLKFLHDKELVHRDISPKNLVFTEKGLLKITNFINLQPLSETSEAVYTGEMCYQSINTILEDKVIYTADDIWSATCILAELILKKKIFNASERDGILKDIFFVLGNPENVWPEFMLLPNVAVLDFKSHSYDFSYNLLGYFFQDETEKELIQKGFCYNPDNRISAEAFLAHPYFQTEPLAMDSKCFGLKLHDKSYKLPVEYKIEKQIESQ